MLNKTNPSPVEIKDLRTRVEMTQTEFGEMGFYSLRTVQDWEAGHRRMHPLTWLAYLHMAGVKDLPRLPPTG